LGRQDLPVFIDFSSYTGMLTNLLSIEQIILDKLSDKLGININLSAIIALGWNVKLLFDHFDEIPNRLKRQMVVEAEKILTTYPSASIVVSCTSANSASQLFDTTKGFYVARILPLTKNQIFELVRRLYDIIIQDVSESNISLNDTQNLITSPELIEWMRTPLEITVAVSCMVSTHALTPDVITTITRKKIITMWLYEWDQQKYQTEDGSGSEMSIFRDTLFFMAYHTYNEPNPQLALPIEAGAEYLVNMGFYQAPARARRELIEALGRIKNATDLLEVPELEFSTDYKFRNQAVRELFAATYLFSVPAETRMRIIGSKFDTSSWRPLFVLLFDIIIYQSITDAEQYLEFILSTINISDKLSASSSDKLLLVSECIRRGKLQNNGIAKKVKASIIEIFNDVEQKVGLKNRIILAEYLGDFGDPRIGNEIEISEGKFWMGYDPFPNDRPVRNIFLPAYLIDVYPITNQEYLAFIEDQGYLQEKFWDPDGWEWIKNTDRKSPKYWFDPRFNKPNYPVVGVSWFEADAYARWAGKRLPTESEWEKAARGNEGNEWAWGNSFNGMNLNCSDSSQIVHGTTPIGIYPAGQSPLGVFDMSGNVSEWVQDWYDAYSGNTNRDTHYGKTFKVRRGGGWGWDRDFVRCTCRNASPRTADYAVCGFRCCR
jgi:formylglycine-generating enzyme required for sulfatase activity